MVRRFTRLGWFEHGYRSCAPSATYTVRCGLCLRWLYFAARSAFEAEVDRDARAWRASCWWPRHCSRLMACLLPRRRLRFVGVRLSHSRSRSLGALALCGVVERAPEAFQGASDKCLSLIKCKTAPIKC